MLAMFRPLGIKDNGTMMMSMNIRNLMVVSDRPIRNSSQYGRCCQMKPKSAVTTPEIPMHGPENESCRELLTKPAIIANTTSLVEP